LLLGGHFENYRFFISLIFQFFSDCGEWQITETLDVELVDTGACLYVPVLQKKLVQFLSPC
jgi:hypothetical protein